MATNHYLYTANGTKLKETITDGQLTHTFESCGNMVYEDSELSYILTPAGRAVPGEEEREYLLEYFLHDYLGNVRVVFGDANRDYEPEVIQENHYYPYGMTMGGLNYVAGLENRYLYQGKELTGDFNLWWQDFHARRFDSQLGRWHVTDPAGQFASPYVGMGNNPMLMVDPYGMRSGDFWKRVGKFIKTGIWEKTTSDGSHPITEWVDVYGSIGGWASELFGSIGEWASGYFLASDGTSCCGLAGSYSFYGGGSESQSYSIASPSSGSHSGGGGTGPWPGGPQIESLNVGGGGSSGKVPKVAISGRDYLEYIGSRLNWYNGSGNLVVSFNATSGLPNYQVASNQNIPDAGPIPAGTYSVNLSLSPNRTASVDPITGEILSGNGIQKIPSSYTTIDGTTYEYPGWGTMRARLNPESGNMYGRHSFYLHNSHKGYSHGCIEVGGGFFGYLINYGQTNSSITVIVRYPSPTTSTYGGTYYP